MRDDYTEADWNAELAAEAAEDAFYADEPAYPAMTTQQTNEMLAQQRARRNLGIVSPRDMF